MELLPGSRADGQAKEDFKQSMPVLIRRGSWSWRLLLMFRLVAIKADCVDCAIVIQGLFLDW